MFRFVLVVGLVLGVAMDAGAQATSLDNVPISTLRRQGPFSLHVLALRRRLLRQEISRNPDAGYVYDCDRGNLIALTRARTVTTAASSSGMR